MKADLPYWMLVAQALGPSIVAIVAALIAGMIAVRQWRTAQDKLRFDLWDRRNSIYQSLRSVLAKTIREGKIDFKDNLIFLRATTGAEFLFEKQVNDYLTKVYQTLVDLEYRGGQIHCQPPDPQRDEHIDKKYEILKWVQEQLNHGAEQVFAPYLDFGNLKRSRKIRLRKHGNI